MADTPIFSWRNHERQFHQYKDRYYKRSLRPDEYMVTMKGETYVPRQGPERLRNEAECLQFIAANTSIPVPKVLEAYEEDGAFVLVTERIEGRDIADLTPEDQSVVMEEAERYVKLLQSLRSTSPGGPTGIMCPLGRAVSSVPVEATWAPRTDPNAEYVFCHCDLGWTNIYIDNDQPRIRAIIDWEYGGYWPAYFELPYYRDTLPTGAQFPDAPEYDRMGEFFEAHRTASDKAKDIV